jgi:hypothetical protein
MNIQISTKNVSDTRFYFQLTDTGQSCLCVWERVTEWQQVPAHLLEAAGTISGPRRSTQPWHFTAELFGNGRHQVALWRNESWWKLGSLFDPKNGNDTFFRNVSWLSTDCKPLYPRICTSGQPSLWKPTFYIFRQPKRYWLLFQNKPFIYHDMFRPT